MGCANVSSLLGTESARVEGGGGIWGGVGLRKAELEFRKHRVK